jgi:hypothetical protein
MANAFPILPGQTNEAYEARQKRISYPRAVSWDLVKDHEKQAYANHYQSLTRLAERGGLSPLELWCVVNDTKWYDKGDMTETKAIAWLRDLNDVEWHKF